MTMQILMFSHIKSGVRQGDWITLKLLYYTGKKYVMQKRHIKQRLYKNRKIKSKLNMYTYFKFHNICKLLHLKVAELK